ncbi:hypothetical protein P154DRAFT_160419 [Amniculicola lignicola CBS 123094]|uniref:Uncharacterized protein n=1 Tax=Amniculicola lignicola CBS 123094 TaxID=1392246 RepID=A0A6A5WIP4_9PLEO|nr:hypothetical protein P154DRAFT_160419 [Amniculicola lignicola CBS 123094]
MTRPKVPPEQRQRTAQACESCKRRKQKASRAFILYSSTCDHRVLEGKPRSIRRRVAGFTVSAILAKSIHLIESRFPCFSCENVYEPQPLTGSFNFRRGSQSLSALLFLDISANSDTV